MLFDRAWMIRQDSLFLLHEKGLITEYQLRRALIFRELLKAGVQLDDARRRVLEIQGTQKNE